MATPRLILPVAPPSFTTSSAPSAAVSYIPPPVHGPTISKPMSYIPPPVHGPTIVKPPAYRLPTPSSPSNNATAQSSQQSTFIPTSPASIGSPVNLGFIPRPVYGAPVSMPSQAPVQQVFNPQSTNMVFQSIVNGQTRFIPTPMGAPNATMYNQGISQGILQPVPQVNYVQTLQPQKPLPNQPIPRMAACETCRKRKRKCDFGRPCGRCASLGGDHQCIYPDVKTGRYNCKKKEEKAEMEAERKKHALGGEKRPIDLEAPPPPGGYKAAAAEVIVLDDDMPPTKRLKGDNDGWGPGTNIIRNVFPTPQQQMVQNTIPTKPSSQQFAPGGLTPQQQQMGQNTSPATPQQIVQNTTPAMLKSQKFAPGNLTPPQDAISNITKFVLDENDQLNIDALLAMGYDTPNSEDIPLDHNFSQDFCGIDATWNPEDSFLMMLPLTPESIHSSPKDVSEMSYEHDNTQTNGETPMAAPNDFDAVATLNLDSDAGLPNLLEGVDVHEFSLADIEPSFSVIPSIEGEDPSIGNEVPSIEGEFTSIENIAREMGFTIFDDKSSTNDKLAEDKSASKKIIMPEVVSGHPDKNPASKKSSVTSKPAYILDEKVSVDNASKINGDEAGDDTSELSAELELELFGDNEE